MKNPHPPDASAAAPETPTDTPAPTTTPTLAETLTRMADDIRAEMDACDRGPSGQLERAWLGLFVMIYRWLAELAGKAVPEWMDDASADEGWACDRRSRHSRASEDGPAKADDSGSWSERDGFVFGEIAAGEDDWVAGGADERACAVGSTTDGAPAFSACEGAARDAMAAVAPEATGAMRGPRPCGVRRSWAGRIRMTSGRLPIRHREPRPVRIWTVTALGSRRR